MANTKSSRVLLNGSKWYIVRYTIVGDGSGDESGALINSTTGDMGTNNSIYSIHSDSDGASGNILFDANTPVLAATIPSGVHSHQDYTKVGGLVNNAGSGKTGDLKLKTIGLGSGDTISVTIKVRKKT